MSELWSRLFTLTLGMLLCTAFTPAQGQQPATQVAYQLPKKTLQKLESVVLPAWNASDEAAFMESMLDVLQRVEIEHLDEIERLGREHGVSSLRDEFGKRVLQDVEQGHAPRASSLRLPVVVTINTYFSDRIKGELADLRTHQVMQEPLELPATWNENEKLFWEVHVFKNRMDSIQRLTEFVVQLSRPLYNRAQRKGDQDTMALLEPAAELNKEFQTHLHQMLENEAELRLMELERVETTLHNEQDFQIRLSAAFALELDERHLREFFQQVDSATITRAALKDPNIGSRIQALIDTSKHYGKDVLEKASLLRAGAHWWLRGRYGMAPMAYGLLKRPEAMESDQAMFGLYMPKARPQPVNWISAEGEISPGYERRHYYTWAVEYRELQIGSGSHSETEVIGREPWQAKTGSYFW
ncbi:MAG: hypothetical protein ACR2NP_10175 [Pirellulaceae bacterium]